MAIVQWVNLEKNSDFLDDPDVESLDRCGKLSVKSAFSSGDVDLSYKVKVTEVGSDNVTYSAAELGRNSNFKMTHGTSDLATDTEVLIEGDIQLPAAGGNKYKLEAKDANGTAVSSEEIETKRKLYYQFMHMEDAKGKVKKYGLGQLEEHSLKNYVVLTKAGGDKKIPFQKNIDTSRKQHIQFASNIRSQYSLKEACKRVGCVTVLSNYLGKRLLAEEKIIHTIGDNSNPAFVQTSNKVSLWALDKSYLWYGLDDDDDKNKEWFSEGEIEFIPDVADKQSKKYSVKLSKSNVEIGGTDLRTYGGRRYIDIIISSGNNIAKILNEKKGTLSITIEIYKVKGFSGGFSYPANGVAITTCCTKAWYQDKREADSSVIWNHELGHRMGMVAHGNKSLTQGKQESNEFFQKRTINKNMLPDAPPNVYGEDRGVNDKGHLGPHCSSGSVTYDASKRAWTGVPGCVLFGATGARDSAGTYHSSPLDYCDKCAPVVRKLDLSF